MSVPPPGAPAGPTHTFRPQFASAAAIVWGLVSAAWVWFAVDDGGLVGLARQAPGMLLAGAGVYAVLVRPAVAVGPSGVRLLGVLRDVDVPWPALAEVSTRWALTLVTTDGRRFSAWAAPASGRHADVRLTAREFGTLGWAADEDLPPSSASPETQSGAVAAWIRREWRRASPDGNDHEVQIHLARPIMVLLGTASALLVVVAMA